MITREGESIRVNGDINHETVARLCKQGNQLIAEMDKPCVDFSHAEHCNSAGLALMMAWLRQAKQSGKRIAFLNVPSSLREAAKVCEVDGILGLE